MKGGEQNGNKEKSKEEKNLVFDFSVFGLKKPNYNTKPSPTAGV
jgi:hypothetical protein